MKKIDFHCHTTNRQVEGVPTATIDAILSEMQKYEIQKTVLLATYFPHRGSGISNFRLRNWIRDKPEFLMFGSLDFEHYFFQGLNELEELADQKAIAGIKIYTGYQNIDLKGDKFRKVMDLAQLYGLPMLFHAGDTSGSMRTLGRIAYAQETSAETLEFVAAEGIKTVVAHLGYPFIDDTIDVLQRQPNMLTDMSGLYYSKDEGHKMSYAVDHLRRVLEYCGPEKVLFGTDFPVHVHAHAIEIAESAMKEFSDEDKEKVYHKNAEGILNGR